MWSCGPIHSNLHLSALLLQVKAADGVLVPGGFGTRGTEGMIAAAHYARTNKKPYFGICLGMQVGARMYASQLLLTSTVPMRQHTCPLLRCCRSTHGKQACYNCTATCCSTCRDPADLCKAPTQPCAYLPACTHLRSLSLSLHAMWLASRMPTQLSSTQRQPTQQWCSCLRSPPSTWAALCAWGRGGRCCRQ